MKIKWKDRKSSANRNQALMMTILLIVSVYCDRFPTELENLFNKLMQQAWNRPNTRYW
jgi:hypothetical protein